MVLKCVLEAMRRRRQRLVGGQHYPHRPVYMRYSEAMQSHPTATGPMVPKLTERKRRECRPVNASRAGSLRDDNVVTVQSEAFSDPARMKGISIMGDPIPFTPEAKQLLHD